MWVVNTVAQVLKNCATLCLQKADKDQLAVAPYYPSGSLVDGVAAALITHVRDYCTSTFAVLRC
jgi:hypothetical protein